MIKEIIASTLLATSIGIQNTSTQTAYNTNKPTTYNSIDTYYEYYNDELEIAKTAIVLDWTDIWIGANLNIKVRSISIANRNIVEDEYIFKQILVMKLNTSLTTTNWNTYIQNQPQYANLINTGLYTYNYIQNPQQNVIDFMNGQSYIDYSIMENLYNSIESQSTFIATMDISANTIQYNNNSQMGNYIVIQTIYDYDSSKITDNGVFMVGLQPYNEVKQTLTWEIPSTYNYEVVDLPGLMFSILGMPFAWMSTAFNFTIFPGTPYSINISQILMAIVIGLIAIYIAKKLIK